VTKKELIKKLRKHKNKNILIKIDGGLFYPINSVKEFDGNIIIFCDDITKVTKD
jgi:hypothetical protein